MKRCMVLICLTWSLHGELLIIKKDGQLFKPLTQEESIKYQTKINDILMKYQWPMCLNSSLTPDEVSNYLVSGKPHAEEQFIQKKLQEVIDPAQIDLQVMFVPTSIYELYVAYKILLVIERPLVPSINIDKGVIKALEINDAAKSKEMFHSVFARANQVFFVQDGVDGATSSTLANRDLTTYLFDLFPELQNQPDIASVSNIVHQKITTLIAKLSQDVLRKDFTILEINREPKNKILKKMVDLEYGARERNEALLIRGSKVINATNFDHLGQKLQLMGSTVRGTRAVRDVVLGLTSKEYSISFGQSLFSGYLNDTGACSYCFLDILSENKQPLFGYGLSLNKQEAFIDGNNGLFYIPALATLASLLSEGEFFHARTKVARMQKQDVKKIHGAAVDVSEFSDPNGVFLIQRNPAYQEELFSNFLVKHGYILQKGTEEALTPEEKNVMSQVLSSQEFLAQEYRKIRVLSGKLLRRLLRAGDRPIPGISEEELTTILTKGPTAQEYARLQKGLSLMALEPVTKDIVSLPGDQLLNQILQNRGLVVSADPGGAVKIGSGNSPGMLSGTVRAGGNVAPQNRMITEAKRRYSTWSQAQQQQDQELSQEAQAEQLQWMKRLRNQQLEPQRAQLESSNRQMSQVHQHEFHPQVPEYPAPKQWSMHRGQTPEQMAIAARAAQRALSRVARSAIR